MRQRWRWWILCVLLVGRAAWPFSASAHVGAPYPVLIEEPVGPYLLSALADPDVGTGTFYVQATLPGPGPDGSPGGQPPPDGTTVTLWVEPEDGHGPAASFAAQRQETRYGERFVAKTAFDAQGPWQIRLVVDGPAGRGETAFPVQVTPSGTGWLGTLVCLVPFLILAALWLRGSRRQRETE